MEYDHCHMTARAFFRPSAATLIGSLVITGVAAWLMVRTLGCALNGTGNCFELPVVVQLILLAILWPWVVVVRLGGAANMQMLGIWGFLLSLVWIYAVLCFKRWLLALIVRKMRKEGNS